MKTVTIEALHERLEAGAVAVFDVRGDIEYERGHIPGAKTAPLGSLVFRVASIMNPESFVVVYSEGDGDSTAAEAVERLTDLRMKNVHALEGGIESWRRAGYQVVESINAKVHTRGPVINCRPVVVDRDRAYGGAFREIPEDVGGAGG